MVQYFVNNDWIFIKHWLDNNCTIMKDYLKFQNNHKILEIDGTMTGHWLEIDWTFIEY